MSIYLSAQSWSEAELKEIQLNPTLAQAENVLSIKRQNPRKGNINLPDGGVLYFASTQPKKFYEIEQIRRSTNAKLRLCDAIDILHWFHSADEQSKTYIGNAYEKAEAILDRIYNDLGYEKVATRIAEQGHDPEKVVFGVNDTGSSLTQDYSKEPEFSDSLHEKGIGPWPGVEFGPVTDAQGGIKGFFSALNNMVKRMRQQGLEPNLSGTDDNIYLFFKLTPKREDVVIQSYYSEVPILNTIKPEPKKLSGVITSLHFSRSTDPRLTKKDRKKSREVLGEEYIGKYSAQAVGLEKFIQDAEIPKSLSIPYDNASRPPEDNIIIATHHNTLPKKKVRKWLPNVIYREDDIRSHSSHINTVQNGAYQRLTRDSDAVILGEHFRGVANNYQDYFLDLFDLWCSLHVDKQLRVETFENTPFFVLNRINPFRLSDNHNEDLEIDWNSPLAEHKFLDFLRSINPKKDPWQAFILFNQFLYEKGFVKQEPRFLHTHLNPDDPKLVKKIRDELDKTRGKKTFIPDYEDERWGTDRTDLFEISILGSASTRVAKYTQEATNLGFWAASNGYHVRTGGGRYGIMGAVANGALNYMGKREIHDPAAHLSAIQMPRTIQFEGAIFRQIDIKDTTDKFLRIADSFDSRMSSLFRSQVCVAIAPGIGTYQEITRWIRLKEAGYQPLQNKTMILINSGQPQGTNHIRLMDPFLTLLPKHIIDKHLIIVPDAKSAKEVIFEKYEIWQREQTPSKNTQQNLIYAA